MILSNAYLSINSVDVSASLRSIEPSFDVDQVDKTCMSSTGMKSVEAGLEGWSIKATLKQAFGGGSVHATLSAAHKTIVPVEFRFQNTTVSATNPKLTGNVLVVYQPKGGSPGTELEADVTLTGDGAYTWETS